MASSVLDTQAVIARRGLRDEQRLDLRNHERSSVFMSGLNNDSDPRTSFRAELCLRD
jgi:hypothetical protein